MKSGIMAMAKIMAKEMAAAGVAYQRRRPVRHQ